MKYTTSSDSILILHILLASCNSVPIAKHWPNSKFQGLRTFAMAITIGRPIRKKRTAENLTQPRWLVLSQMQCQREEEVPSALLLNSSIQQHCSSSNFVRHLRYAWCSPRSPLEPFWCKEKGPFFEDMVRPTKDFGQQYLKDFQQLNTKLKSFNMQNCICIHPHSGKSTIFVQKLDS